MRQNNKHQKAPDWSKQPIIDIAYFACHFFCSHRHGFHILNYIIHTSSLACLFYIWQSKQSNSSQFKHSGHNHANTTTKNTNKTPFTISFCRCYFHLHQFHSHYQYHYRSYSHYCCYITLTWRNVGCHICGRNMMHFVIILLLLKISWNK